MTSLREFARDQTHHLLHLAERDQFNPSIFMEKRGLDMPFQGGLIDGTLAWINCHNDIDGIPVNPEEMEQRRRMAPTLFFTGMCAGMMFKEMQTASGIILLIDVEDAPQSDPGPTDPQAGVKLRAILDDIQRTLFGPPRG